MVDEKPVEKAYITPGAVFIVFLGPGGLEKICRNAKKNLLKPADTLLTPIYTVVDTGDRLPAMSQIIRKFAGGNLTVDHAPDIHPTLYCPG